MEDQRVGNLRAGDAKFLRAVEVCRREGLKGPSISSVTFLSAHANWRGEYRAAIDYADEAERLAQDTHEGFFELMAGCFRCNAHAGLGEWDRAFEILEGTVQRGRERQNRYAVARGLNTLGWFHEELGDVGRAIELNREGIELSREAKITNCEIYAIVNLAGDHLALAEAGAARTVLEGAAERLRTGFFDSHKWKWSMRVALEQARLALLEGDLERAAEPLAEGLGIAERTESRKYLAFGHRLRGELLLAGGRREEGLAALRQAAELATAVDSPRVIWETSAALGRALAAAGREAQARVAYGTAVQALVRTLPHIPDPRLRQTLLSFEPMARLREEARRLGVPSAVD
jgi:tetratricopeptide (TPR) repeat protein